MRVCQNGHILLVFIGKGKTLIKVDTLLLLDKPIIIPKPLAQ